MGHNPPMGHSHFPARRLLPHHLAVALAAAHAGTGGSYRAVARRIGIDHAYWRRLTKGERLPSTAVAWRIINELGLDDHLAEALMAAAAEKPDSRWAVVR